MSITFRPQAIDELADLLARIRARSERAAGAVEQRVVETLSHLEANPQLGATQKTGNPRLTGLRFATVRRYPQFVILYLPTADGIEVLHILRGRRNIQAILDDD